jgi:hypothetical protein
MHQDRPKLLYGCDLAALVGFVLGFLISYIPLLLVRTDPFDELISYISWFGGLFLAAMVISIARSEKVWRWAFAVGFGFPSAVAVNIFMKPDSYQLPPLTVLFALLVGMISAFSGAYFAKMLKSMLKKRKGVRNHFRDDC